MGKYSHYLRDMNTLCQISNLVAFLKHQQRIEKKTKNKMSARRRKGKAKAKATECKSSNEAPSPCRKLQELSLEKVDSEKKEDPGQKCEAKKECQQYNKMEKKKKFKITFRNT